MPPATSSAAPSSTTAQDQAPGPGRQQKKKGGNAPNANAARKLTATSHAFVPTPQPPMMPAPMMPPHYPVHGQSNGAGGGPPIMYPHAHGHAHQSHQPPHQQQYMGGYQDPYGGYPPQHQQYGGGYPPQQQQQYPPQHMYPGAMPQDHHHHHQQEQHPLPPQPPTDLALEEALVQEIDRLFSLENLQKDHAVARHMRSGTVPFDCLITFPAIKKLSTDRAVLARAVGRSQVVALSQHDKRIGRRDHAAGGDLGWRTIELKNMSKESTEDTVKGLVGKYGELAFLELAWQGEGDAAAAAAGRNATHRRALVTFVEATAALKCMEALSGTGSNWRAGFRASFLNGFSVIQAVRHLGVTLDSETAKEGGGNGSSSSSNGGSASSSSTAANGSAAAPLPPLPEASLVLPPTIPEGEHTGVIMEVDGQGQGVLKREGKRRTIISFAVPDGLVLVAGDRVAFSVKHVENKAIVQNLSKAAPGSAPLVPTKCATASTSGGGGKSGGTGPSSHRMAKGPDASLGFKMPRTKPPVELAEVVEAMKLSKSSSAVAGKK